VGIEKAWGTARSRSCPMLAPPGTFNRGEGPPGVFGPRSDWKLPANLRLRIDAQRALRTAGDHPGKRRDLRYLLRTAPQAGVPTAVRAPIPTDGSYAFSRLFLDSRRYTRVSPSGRINLRVFAGGWIGGDPLLLQQRLSTGGPDPLAGYGFRHSGCNGDIIDPAFGGTRLAACDRVILAQAEYRGHLSLHWSYGSSAPEDEGAK